MRRARNVFQALVNRGCNPAQLSTVAIGKNQPIAPNASESGRALNRRVEFLISANQNANLAVVRLQPINPAYLKLNPTDVGTVRPERVTVLKPDPYNGPADISETAPHGMVTLTPFANVPLQGVALKVPPSTPPKLAEPSPLPQLERQIPEPFERMMPGPPLEY
jgi:hypothetical protein